MGRRGPPPKPTKAKKLQGTYRRDRAAVREWQPPAGAPPMPDDLDAFGEKTWRKNVDLLLPPGILTLADGDALADYCRAMSRARAADLVVKREGLTVETTQGIKEHPACAIGRKERAAAKQLRALFGLDPSSRSKLSTPEKPKEDPTEDFLFGGLKVVK